MVSPKQPTSLSDRDWYPYYAGFTEDFAESVLRRHLTDARLVLDPWSGSGTTTAVCARLGVNSIGIDINPALTVIARARLTPRSGSSSRARTGRELLQLARHLAVEVDTGDPLRRWMRTDAVARVRAIQSAIHQLISRDLTPRQLPNVASQVDRLPKLVCFFYSALFATVRDLLSRFRASNPMWLKSPSTYRHKIATSWKRLAHTYADRIQYLEERLSLDHASCCSIHARLETGSATSLSFSSASFDGILTSPPYATRIDYVVGFLPELAVLGTDHDCLRTLRMRSTGTPVVGKSRSPGGTESVASEHGAEVLKQIRDHPSKGSRPYYMPWMLGYLNGLQAGLFEAVRTVIPDGPICIVVQDSYYKAVHIDLQRIVVEMLNTLGKHLRKRYDYPVTHLRSRMNPRARRYLKTRGNRESLLVFQ